MLWYVGWVRDAQNFVSLHNFQTLIGYVGDGLASSLSTLTGLAVPRDEMAFILARLGAAPARDRRRLRSRAPPRGRCHRDAAAALGCDRRAADVLVADRPQRQHFWRGDIGPLPDRRPVVLGVMILAELVSTTSRSAATWLLGIVLAASALAALANFSLLRQSANGLAGIAEQERGGLAALELARAEVAPDFVLTHNNSGVDYLGIPLTLAPTSRRSTTSARRPTRPPSLLAAPEVGLVAADMVFAAALFPGCIRCPLGP